MAKLLAAARSAHFYMSSALATLEFRTLLKVYNRQPSLKVSSGAKEILACLELLQSDGRRPRMVKENHLMVEFRNLDLDRPFKVELRALSPSEKKYQEFLLGLPAELQALAADRVEKGRLQKTNRNALSSALLLSAGEDHLLLGADLEEEGDVDTGWSAVLSILEPAGRRAFMLKVPHHGSMTGHHGGVWSELLHSKPVSVVTSWNLGGRSLPTDEDKARLARLSGSLYWTGRRVRPVKRTYPRDSMKVISHSGVDLKRAHR
jgi:hypothetical protein